MRANVRRAGFTLSFLCVLCVSVADAQPRWFKGNTHTHTSNTDGDSAPDSVVRWYKEHGYQFVVISDHDSLTPVEGLNAVFAAPGKFLVLTGVEVTDRFEGKPVHLIGIGVRDAVLPQGGATIQEILERDARAIQAAGGLPHANHSNFGWTLTSEHIALAPSVKHFELWNGHPLVHNRGGGGSASTEEIWDAMLTSGRLIYGLATDDAHHFKGEFTPAHANPGRAWIVVRAPELSSAALLAAIERGEFYASTGVTLKDYQVSDTGIRIELATGSGLASPRYRTYFLGRDSQVLRRDDSLTPSYTFTGTELFVRARIESSTGAVAWTQPVFLKDARR